MPAGDRTSATIDAQSESLSFGPDGPFRVHIAGTWVGTIELQVTTDGSTYDTCKTYTGNPTTDDLVHATRGIGKYRLYATAWTSGSATVVMASV